MRFKQVSQNKFTTHLSKIMIIYYSLLIAREKIPAIKLQSNAPVLFVYRADDVTFPMPDMKARL